MSWQSLGRKTLRPAFLAGLVLCAGCSAGEVSVIPRLAQEERATNAERIGDMVERLCVANSNDNARFAEALASTGWPFVQVQGANGDTQLAVWRLPEAELVHSQQPIRPRGTAVWVCSLRVPAAFAPDAPDLQTALSGRFGEPRGDISEPVTWEWRPTLLHQATMTLGTIAPADGGGVMVFVELAEPTFN